MNKAKLNKLELIVLNYFGKDYKLIPKVESSLLELREKVNALYLDSNNIKKEKLDISFFILVRGFIDLILIIAKEKFDKIEFLDLLIEIGKALIDLAAYSLARVIFEKALSMSEDDKKLVDFKANIYFYLGNLFYKQAIWKNAIDYLTRANKIFSEIKFVEGIVKSFNSLGVLSGERGDFLKAQNYFNECLKLLDSKSLNLLQGLVQENIALTLLAKSDYDMSFVQFNRALAIFESLSDFEHLAEIRYNIGLNYLLKKNYEYALSEFDNSLNISFKAENVRILNFNLSAKANAYAFLNDFDQSFAFLNKSMDLSTAINDRLTIADLYKIKGILSKKLKKKKKAEKDFLTSLRLNEELENKFNYFETMFELGLLYKEWGKNDLAKEKLIKALNYKTKIGAENAAKNINHELKEL